MAPEQAAGRTKELTAAADVYALGAVFYQMLTSQPPFAGGTTYETIRLVLETEPRSPRLGILLDTLKKNSCKIVIDFRIPKTGTSRLGYQYQSSIFVGRPICKWRLISAY